MRRRLSEGRFFDGIDLSRSGWVSIATAMAVALALVVGFGPAVARAEEEQIEEAPAIEQTAGNLDEVQAVLEEQSDDEGTVAADELDTDEPADADALDESVVPAAEDEASEAPEQSTKEETVSDAVEAEEPQSDIEEKLVAQAGGTNTSIETATEIKPGYRIMSFFGTSSLEHYHYKFKTTNRTGKYK